MLDKTFDPAAAEGPTYRAWEESGAFAPSEDPAAPPFSIVIPPPNITGQLHIGHALNGTLQDILIRFARMRGMAALWLPGTDHAGIATQMVVERQLAEAGNISRRDMGREAFVERVWAWKARSGGAIVNQLRRMGASCDWSRERFTLDEGLSAAVRRVFVALHREKLIYRDKRLVNWDPHFQSAISDIEVEQREVDGHFWHFAYPLEDGTGEIVVATTRPETMLGDTAVAVHPSDERYKALIGKCVRLPIVGRPIPIIADDYADPEKGSGAVKITPAHDFNDFRVGQRHRLPVISIMDEQARINENAPAEFRGLDRFVARKKVVEQFEALGLLRGVEPTRHAVPHGDRSGVVLEPLLTDQWYVDAKTLAKPAIEAVEGGRTVFEPRAWEKTYLQWMRNIEPWCISRQLWWGHRIPAWYGPDGRIFVAETPEGAAALAREHYGRDEPLRQDEDVLDTWFSSALWPFSTLGWPEKTADLARFYPTHTLVTGFDIIFFWVARMMMMGLHFTGDVPFRRVFINALVRDAEGAKMSKSKGNVMDPLALVDDYGADALRFTLAAMSGQGRDIRLSRPRIEGYRNLGTKLWNAARFCQMNGCAVDPAFDPASAKLTLNRWIRSETVAAARAITGALDGCGFDEAAQDLYRFIWNTFCDWYVEAAKPLLQGQDEAAAAETRAMAAWALDQILKLLHPISPFVTETLWRETAPAGGRANLLIVERWPDLDEAWVDAAARDEIGLVVAAVSEARSVRAELNVPASARPHLFVVEASAAQRSALEANASMLAQTLRSGALKFAAAPPSAVVFVVQGATFALDVGSLVDLPTERARLAKEIAARSADIDKTAKKLANADFVSRAPEEVVEENRERLAEAEAARDRLSQMLERLAVA
ncbi:MAG TPA: valine--tRNA ligase [Caulobacteraceae bacterium]|jgi:valyl-tRNA synthetase|nr:valine--tRNA ligase [Caulobacteraceae bacterium]